MKRPLFFWGSPVMMDAMNIRAIAISLCLLTAACEPADNAPTHEGVTVGEAKALDEAAAALDSRDAPLVDAKGAPVTEKAQ